MSGRTVQIIRSGGVVGGRRAWTLDAARLAPPARRALAAAPRKRAPAALSQSSRTAGGRRATETPAARDLIQYRFVVTARGRKKSFVFDDQTLPRPLRDLVAQAASGGLTA